MKCEYACGQVEHRIARRSFLGGLAAGVAAPGCVSSSLPNALAGELQTRGKQLLVVFLAGGVSQLETWDPKPGTDTGGPFRPIATSVPGIQICELLPFTAQQMHHLSIVRSINTKENDHGKGRYAMEHGRKQEAASAYPHLGSVSAKMLDPIDSALPGYIKIVPGNGGSRGNDAAYLGAAYSSVTLGDGKPPQNIARPDSLSVEIDNQRNQLRRRADERFLSRRRTAMTEAYTSSYENALRLMERREAFDVALESDADRQRYGDHDFGRHCLLARRLLQQGVTFVQVQHTNYDTHHENFNFHIEQLGEFDRPFATLIQDLHECGLLETTLVVVMSEFGRTPRINDRYGRDHWGTAWSVALGGAGIQRGAVIGATNANGTAVSDREVDHGHLFHTYLQAVGIDSTESIDAAGKPTPLADPSREPIRELLA
ncbi:MAG: DUF1501 domain-containing protein [Planctomycetales bacterium]|nr:DUF1501 domain-containing protein [Planctomycetales bacterium]